MYVIGTAGHVDHGKSTLVKALTGIDPDRLQEEKDREMTIDLGFAWMDLPSGIQVGVVDVPGHERFIKNMLAGVGGIDLCILIIAADESVMPQTKEHLAILDLLQIKTGLIALTKIDLVDPDWTELVAEEIKEVVSGTVFENAPIVPVSAITGSGIEELKNVLDRLLQTTATRKDLSRPRLPVDRVFTISGFGTIVTGTLLDGTLSLAQEVEFVPSNAKGRIRGLQSHGKRLEVVHPGTRVAVNLSGINRDVVTRGEILTLPGWLHPSDILDVQLRVTPWTKQSIRHNRGITFHSGTNETFGRLRLLDSDRLAPGEVGWAQILLRKGLPVIKGDPFIVRSSQWTLGGGRVLDPSPRRHRRFQDHVLNRLESLLSDSPRESILEILRKPTPVQFERLINEANISAIDGKNELNILVDEGAVIVMGSPNFGSSTFIISADSMTAVRTEVDRILEFYHKTHPLRPGIPKEELRRRLEIRSSLYPEFLAALERNSIVVEAGVFVKKADHVIQLTTVQEQEITWFISALESEPYSPPTNLNLDPEILSFLIAQQRVIKVSDDLHFSATAYQEMVSRVVTLMQEKGKINVRDVRDLFGTSRKYALPFLEHLDQIRVTRRIADDRVLVKAQ